MQSLAVIDGRYQLVRRLGEGGMGSVYEGKHVGTGRRVAVKVVPPEVLAKGPDVQERFRREAMATGAIESQHIAHVLDTGFDSDSRSPYIVMELLVGEDLQQALRRVRRFVQDVALRIAAQACMGLEKAHAAGVIHRDVKPANLFLARRDADVVVKLLDFGIAKARVDPLDKANADMTAAGAMLGSPLYMSPEQARGRKAIDPRADLFSLGVVLYELLTGMAPHAGADTIGDLIVRICGEPARPIQELAPWVNAATAAIVHKALAIEPSARFASASEMLAALKALLPRGVTLDADAFGPLPASHPEPPPRKPMATRPPVDPESSTATVAHTPSSKVESAERPKEISTGSGKRPLPEKAATTPASAATKAREPQREAQERRIFVPAARRAAVLLWGEEGLNQIARTLNHDSREEFFKATSADEWVPTRMVIDWCYQVFEGPCRRDIAKMREYIDRTFDYSFGVVRKAVLRFADPVALVAKIPGFWKQDHVGGEMDAELDPSGKGANLRLRGSPFTETPQTRAGMAENYRYAFSLTRAKDVTESNALERSGERVLVMRIRWK